MMAGASTTIRAVLLSAIIVVPAVAGLPPAAAGETLDVAGTGAARTDANAEERLRLLGELKAAKDEPTGRAVEKALWQFWIGLTDDTTQMLLTDAMEARRSHDWDRALTLLHDVVDRAPHYAEGWNQRAFIWFLKEEYDKSLQDLDRTLELEPKHFGALAGKFHVLFRQGRAGLAYAALREAVAIHPWLRERGMLPPGEREDGVDL